MIVARRAEGTRGGLSPRSGRWASELQSSVLFMGFMDVWMLGLAFPPTVRPSVCPSFLPLFLWVHFVSLSCALLR